MKNSSTSNLENHLIQSGILSPKHLTGSVKVTASWIIDHTTLFSENSWFEAIVKLAPDYSIWPSGDLSKLPQHRCSSQLFEDFGALILQIQPFLVVGVVDPSQDYLLAPFLAEQGLNDPVLCLVSPHLVSQYQKTQGSSFHWDHTDPVEFAKHLDLSHAKLSNSHEIASYLFESQKILLIPPGYLITSIPLQQVPEALLVQKAFTSGIFVTSKIPSVELSSSVHSFTGLKPTFLIITADDFIRLTDQHKISLSTSIERTSVTQWNSLKGVNYEISELFSEVYNAAYFLGASDISVEPKSGHSSIRFRINGDYHTQPSITLDQHDDFLKRAKIVGDMSKTERGIPQDGYSLFTLRNNKNVELRHAIIPCSGSNESLTSRLLNLSFFELKNLKISPLARKAINRFLASDGGLFCISGVTGSGKSTTLYACLNELMDPMRKVMTFESPIERTIPLSVQVPISKKGLSFADAARITMRSDPDVIMVGECNNPESADFTMQMAQSGHLTFTTTHALDVCKIIDRFTDSFKIDRSTLANVARLFLHQALIARLCPHCTVTRPAKSEELEGLPSVDISHPVVGVPAGCPACRNTGIADRFAITEILHFDDAMTSLLISGANSSVILKANKDRGFLPLIYQATELALSGQISIKECQRFVGATPL